MLDVSIIIINYNTFELTSACIASVYKYTSEIQFEIILVDNASTELDPGKFKEKFPEIKLIKSVQNVGFSKGNNLGLSQASGNVILLLNSDTKLCNNAVKIAYERLIQNSTVGVLSGKLIYPDGTIQYTASRFPSLSRELVELSRLNKLLSQKQIENLYLGDRFDHLSEREVDWVWGAFFMIPRKVIELLPDRKLPDDFFMYGEDMQWCFKIKKMGFKVLYSPDPVVMHYIGGSAISIEDEWSRYKAKMLPNIKQILVQEKGIMYTLTYYVIKFMHCVTLRKSSEIKKGWQYLKVIFE